MKKRDGRTEEIRNRREKEERNKRKKEETQKKERKVGKKGNQNRKDDKEGKILDERIRQKRE